MSDMTKEEFDFLYPEGSLIRQEKIRELEAAVKPEPQPEPESEPEVPAEEVPAPELPVNPVGGSTIPESVWRAG